MLCLAGTLKCAQALCMLTRQVLLVSFKDAKERVREGWVKKEASGASHAGGVDAANENWVPVS